MADPQGEAFQHTTATTMGTVADEAVRLVEAATAAGLTLRMIGSAAIREHTPAFRWLIDALGRRPVLDVDLVGLASKASDIRSFFAGHGYAMDQGLVHAVEYGIKRQIFYRPDGLKVDVFLDDLIMSHTVALADRLDVDTPTISLADLVLAKIQIHEITKNDLIDLVALFAEHDLGSGEPDTIDVRRVAAPLADDWGFWWSARGNLEAVTAFLTGAEAVPAEVAATARDRITRLVEALDAAPKSRGWRWRARVGTRLRWYEEVGEVER